MKRFGIVDEHALGIPVPELRKIAKAIKKGHNFCQAIVENKIHKAGILASIDSRPKLFTGQLADSWVDDFNL